MQRTQIYFPEELREEIDKQRAQSGESLAEYVRKAAEEKVKKDRKEKADLKKLAADFVAFAKRNRKSKKEVDRIVKEIREDRAENDAHMLKKWEDATRS